MFVIVAADFGLLFSAGVFIPSSTTYRMAATPDAFMSRVGTSRSVGAKTCQAAFVVVGGLIAAAAGVRGALLIAGLLCVASALLLPWRKARFSMSMFQRLRWKGFRPRPRTVRPRNGFPGCRDASCLPGAVEAVGRAEGAGAG
ncbi:hypothetical protein [Streptomyces sp. NPDC057781]|uniref:hypothetical protein n=1 Tax=unclassified Streptomyces TaxID=2593676 RepID=UPI00368E9AFF